MQDQRGARFLAFQRAGSPAPEEPPEDLVAAAPLSSPLAERLDPSSILAVLPILGLSTVADFERAYAPRQIGRR